MAVRHGLVCERSQSFLWPGPWWRGWWRWKWGWGEWGPGQRREEEGGQAGSVSGACGREPDSGTPAGLRKSWLCSATGCAVGAVAVPTPHFLPPTPPGGCRQVMRVGPLLLCRSCHHSPERMRGATRQEPCLSTGGLSGGPSRAPCGSRAPWAASLLWAGQPRGRGSSLRGQHQLQWPLPTPAKSHPAPAAALAHSHPGPWHSWRVPGSAAVWAPAAWSGAGLRVGAGPATWKLAQLRACRGPRPTPASPAFLPCPDPGPSPQRRGPPSSSLAPTKTRSRGSAFSGLSPQSQRVPSRGRGLWSEAGLGSPSCPKLTKEPEHTPGPA